MAVPVTARESVGSTARGPGPEHKGGFPHLGAHRQPFQPKVLVVDRTIGARRTAVMLRQFPRSPRGTARLPGPAGLAGGCPCRSRRFPGRGPGPHAGHLRAVFHFTAGVHSEVVGRGRLAWRDAQASIGRPSHCGR